jgi:HK97 family phage prohead protease
MKDAFKENDGEIVPLVWNHRHDESFNVLGHALLENRENGVYAYCTFNDTESGKNARLLVKHGDITALSIYANQLRQQGGNVLHGAIREVSLVLAGANPGAYIDSVISHGESSDEEAIIYTGEDIVISHGSEESEKEEEEMDTTSKKAKSENEETVADVFNTLTEKQKTVVYALIGQALEDSSKSDSDETEEGGNKMKHNVFDQDEEMTGEVLSHSEMMAVISDAKRYGSMKQSALEHGITNVDYLFPEAKTITNTPDFIQRDTGWAKKVMNSVHHTPFSRIKSVLADITEDDARAKGYIKGNRKKEEVFSLLKRTTTPTTVYKKQKMDRDDVIDITDFDVVAWLKSEMRLMLDEELARAYLVGDGRTSSSDDKINEMNIRPVWTDDDLYTIKQTVSVTGGATEDDKAREFIRAAIKARKNYKGSGSPSLYINEDMLTACLLLTDTTGRDLYDSVEKLATKLRVKEIITVPVMENLKRDDASTKKSYELAGIIVNLADYNVGADNGGSVNLFDDFDIDYNAQKYLIETRCSGALTKPYSAIAIEFESTSDSASDGASE